MSHIFYAEQVLDRLDDVPPGRRVALVEALLKLDPAGVVRWPVRPAAVVVLQVVQAPFTVSLRIDQLVVVGARTPLASSAATRGVHPKFQPF